MIRKFINRKRTQREYFKISGAIGDINAELYTTFDPAARADMLDQAAAMELRLALMHTDAFGTAPNPHEGGRDLSESLASSSRLLHMLAATEHAAADLNEGSRYAFWCIDDRAEPAEFDLWVQLATTRDRGMRAHLIDQIADHAADRVGGQAAEALACQMHAERELANAAREDRKPKAPPEDLRKTRIAAGVFIGVLFVCAVVLDLIPHLK